MKKAILYLIIVTLVLFGLRQLIYVGLRKNTSGEFDKLNTLFIKKNKYDVLIIGSSRAESHFVPTVIDSITELNSFNAGQSGAMQQLNLSVLKSYLVNSIPPKIVVINIDIHLPSAEKDTIHHFPKYFPYLVNDTLYSYLKQQDARFGYFKWLPFYSLPFTTDYYLSTSLHGWLNHSTKDKEKYIKGFLPEQQRVENLETDKFPTLHHAPNDKFYNSIQATIQVCKQYNIKPILVISPMYYRLSEAITNKQQITTKLKQLADEASVVLLDYTSDEMCANKNYFINSRHLNEAGAYTFSRKFTNDLLQK